MNDETPDSTPPASRPPDALELVCAGILRTEFGRRPSQAASNAVLRIAAEEAAADPSPATSRPKTWFEKIHGWFAALPPRPAFALGSALLLVTAGSLWILHSHFGGQDSVAALVDGCKLTDAADARWASGSPALKIGGQVPPKNLRLESGVVEITFSSGARVAIEGPAQFRLTSGNAMQLQSGKAATDVPRKARGFTLETPTANVVDLGTRFGAIVSADKSSEVDVFQGRVNLRTPDGKSNPLSAGMAMFVDTNGATPAGALPESAFPGPNVDVEMRPQNCGFDNSSRAAAGDVPVDFGYWSGQAFTITGATPEVRPANGPGMLEFYNAAVPHQGDSEVWQIIDLRAHKKLFAAGNVTGKLTVQFNRAPGGADAAKKFGLTLAAFHGAPADAQKLWANRQKSALALADKELDSDNDPATWETLEADAPLPAETDFVMVEIRAIAPPGAVSGALEGHFADLVNLHLSAPLRASSIAIK